MTPAPDAGAIRGAAASVSVSDGASGGPWISELPESGPVLRLVLLGVSD